MEVIELTVELRDVIGSVSVNRLRRQGIVPGVMYSEGKPAKNVQVDALDFGKKTTGVSHSHLYQIKSSSAELNGKLALIKDMQIEPLKQRVDHVDFYEIHAGHKIVVTVPVELIGECGAVKQKTAVLAQSLYEVEIECQPTEIPESLTLDITSIEVGHSLFAGDIKLPEGVRLKTDIHQNVVSAIVPAAEEAAPVAAPAAAAAAAPVAAAATTAAAPAKDKKSK